MADIDFGQLSEALNDKSDRNLRNVDTTVKADAVIDYQEPTAQNGYTWYRKYASGWVEQGQSRVAAADQVIQITFPIEMADIYYVWSIGRHVYNNTAVNVNDRYMGVIERTTTGFRATDKWGNTYAWSWQVSGMAAN